MHAFRESSVPADQYTSERGKWPRLAKRGDIPVGGRVDKISVLLIYNVFGLMKRDRNVRNYWNVLKFLVTFTNHSHTTIHINSDILQLTEQALLIYKVVGFMKRDPKCGQIIHTFLKFLVTFINHSCTTIQIN